MGSTRRFDYSCLGDAVNLASRLEGASKNYGVALVLGEGTAKRIAAAYTVVELDRIIVKVRTVLPPYSQSPTMPTVLAWPPTGLFSTRGTTTR